MTGRESLTDLLARCWYDPDPSVRWLARFVVVVGGIGAVLLLLALAALGICGVGEFLEGPLDGPHRGLTRFMARCPTKPRRPIAARGFVVPGDPVMSESDSPVVGAGAPTIQVDPPAPSAPATSDASTASSSYPAPSGVLVGAGRDVLFYSPKGTALPAKVVRTGSRSEVGRDGATVTIPTVDLVVFDTVAPYAFPVFGVPMGTLAGEWYPLR